MTATATQNPPTPTPTPSPSACSSTTIPPTPGAGTGTNLTFTFSGAAPSLMCVVRNGACGITPGTYPKYLFHILGTVNGTLYTFIIIIYGAQNYTGPGTYTTSTYVALNTGDNIGLSEGNHVWEAVRTGTVTVNGGEESGSVDALMDTNYNTSGTVHVTGNWTCSTLQRG